MEILRPARVAWQDLVSKKKNKKRISKRKRKTTNSERQYYSISTSLPVYLAWKQQVDDQRTDQQFAHKKVLLSISHAIRERPLSSPQIHPLRKREEDQWVYYLLECRQVALDLSAVGDKVSTALGETEALSLQHVHVCLLERSRKW